MSKDKEIIKAVEGTDEPIFVIRAQDELSLDLLNHYAYMCGANGVDDEFIDAIDERIVEFEEWQDANPDKVKLPD